MKKQSITIIISFILPVFILLAVYMAWGQYPFGGKTLLIWDMDEQYAPFFVHLHEILHGNASALYTFSRALGGNMLNVAAYYLISPFNLIFYFFDAENIYIGILLANLLKTGAAGVSMYWFLGRKRRDVSALAFSTAYALSAYMVGYQFNIFWIDALILLPLVCGGIERLVDGRKYFLYIFSLALSVITNFYMGYMVCIFSVLYFICYFFFISDKKYRFKTILGFIAASFMGGLLSMCISLPALDIMRDGKSGISLSILKNFRNMFGYGELFDAAFCATISDKQITSGKPLIYCGVFAVIMVLYWLFCGKDAARKKFAYILLLFVLAVSFHHYNLNCVWHAFNRPVGSPYRFSFIYIFLFLYMAYRGYVSLAYGDAADKYDKRVIICIGMALGLALIGRAGAFIESSKMGILALNILLVAVYIGLILIIKNKSARLAVVLLCTCAELFVNAERLYTVSPQYESISVKEYQDYIQEMLPVTGRIKEAGDAGGGIYRTAIERGVRRTSNDPFVFGLYGMSSYTSVEKQNVIQIAGRFGYSNNILWGMHYNNGTTRAGDSFLGVKYIISAKNPGKGCVMLEESDSFALWENENALPFAFFTDKSIMEASSFDNSFLYINELYHSLDTERDEDVFKELAGELALVSNCSETEDGGLAVSKEAEEAYLEYEFETESEMAVYTRYDKAGVAKAQLFIGNETVDISEQRSDIKSLGNLPDGTKFRLRFYLPENGVLSPDRIYVYSERGDALEAYAADARAMPVSVVMHNEAHIAISCRNEDEETKYLLCTIPYDKGWRIKVDGQETDAALDVQNFIALPIETGVHEVELEFIPRGLYAGIGMSLLAAALLLALAYYVNRSRAANSPRQ